MTHVLQSMNDENQESSNSSRLVQGWENKFSAILFKNYNEENKEHFIHPCSPKKKAQKVSQD